MLLSDFEERLRQRDAANPEAATLRRRLVRQVMENSLLHASKFDRWLTQSQAAELLSFHRGTINRAVKSGRVLSNGLAGRACLIDPVSLYEFYVAREAKQLASLQHESN